MSFVVSHRTFASVSLLPKLTENKINVGDVLVGAEDGRRGRRKEDKETQSKGSAVVGEGISSFAKRGGFVGASFITMFKLTLTLLALSALTCATSLAWTSRQGLVESRRSAIKEVIALAGGVTVSCSRPCHCYAAAPFAPTDALLPAARVKVTIDSAVGLAKELNAPDRPDRRELLEQLETMLLLPQNYTRGRQVDVPQKPAQVGAGVDFELLSNSLTFECRNPQLPQSYLNAYSEYRSKVSILERPGALIVQVSALSYSARRKVQCC